MTMTFNEILDWLHEHDSLRLETLYAQADNMRKEHVGDQVHLRGLIEFSNHCSRLCTYCGLRAEQTGLQRYRMTADEIIQCALTAHSYGYGTVVLQSGEDYGYSIDWMVDVIRSIKTRTPLAVTMSIGERTPEELRMIHGAGADRYLLRFETSDPDLFRQIHPPIPGRTSDRIELLRIIKEIGFEAGSGIMVGIPGQTYASVARDILKFGELDLDMIGIGPYIPHPQTPLGRIAALPSMLPDQTPADEEMVYKTIALTRLIRPDSNIPSTTALATINKTDGREKGLMRGANIVMPNITPVQYRRMYEIYPAKACVDETVEQCRFCLEGRIASIGRVPGSGKGSRDHSPEHSGNVAAQ